MTVAHRATAIESPCIRLCRMHPRHGLCEGCGRTLAEIGGWLSMSAGQRCTIMAALPGRLAAMAEPI
ncbi:DUF1289 domain-containing protein [Phreatobacter sp. HK31-P]